MKFYTWRQLSPIQKEQAHILFALGNGDDYLYQVNRFYEVYARCKPMDAVIQLEKENQILRCSVAELEGRIEELRSNLRCT